MLNLSWSFQPQVHSGDSSNKEHWDEVPPSTAKIILALLQVITHQKRERKSSRMAGPWDIQALTHKATEQEMMIDIWGKKIKKKKQNWWKIKTFWMLSGHCLVSIATLTYIEVVCVRDSLQSCYCCCPHTTFLSLKSPHSIFSKRLVRVKTKQKNLSKLSSFSKYKH